MSANEGELPPAPATGPVRGWTHRILVASVVLALLAISLAMGGTADAATQDADVGAEQAADAELVVDLEEDGDATVTLVSTYDLADEDQRAAIETLEEDAEARAANADRFAERLETVAADAEARTDRQMSIGDPATDVTVGDDVGVVRVRATWSNLAAAEDDLVVREPFASGFDADRPLTVVGPDGYELSETSPEPATASDGEATWNGDGSLDSFEASFEASGDDDATPGFGLAAAALALGLATVGLARTRWG